MSHLDIGFGCKQPHWILHIANRPELEAFQNDNFHTLVVGEAAEIIQLTSNHWRKVFSIMAKISFALFDTQCDTWQQYRDTKLLTSDGFEAINFSPFERDDSNCISIICGFAYAEQQVDLTSLVPHQKFNKLLISTDKDLIVTPYFDWRQLNNEILASLIVLLESFVVQSECSESVN